MIIKNGLVFGADCVFAARDVYIDDGTITKEPGKRAGSEATYDAAGDYVLPGFVDIHTHGAVNRDFCDADPDGIAEMLKWYGSQGVTSVVFATMSYPETVITDVIRAARPFFGEEGYGAVLRGVNMEGPFIYYNKRGAQNPDYLMDPDFGFFKRIFDISGGYVRFVDLAPELPGALEFIGEASRNCRVSLAHTEATYAEAAAAFDAGASHVTHLFNAMTAFSHREPGVVGAAADKADFVEIISDGLHVHPSVVRAAFRLFGAERVCLISDSMRAAGMPDGDYAIGGQAVRVQNGKATLADDNTVIAGSVANLADMCRMAIGSGVPVEHALRAAALNPAIAAGLDCEVGSIDPGKRADIVIWDKGFNTKAVFSAGKKIR